MTEKKAKLSRQEFPADSGRRRRRDRRGGRCHEERRPRRRDEQRRQARDARLPGQSAHVRNYYRTTKV